MQANVENSKYIYVNIAIIALASRTFFTEAEVCITNTGDWISSHSRGRIRRAGELKRVLSKMITAYREKRFDPYPGTCGGVASSGPRSAAAARVNRQCHPGNAAGCARPVPSGCCGNVFDQLGDACSVRPNGAVQLRFIYLFDWYLTCIFIIALWLIHFDSILFR